jgi:hypothetical protein
MLKPQDRVGAQFKDYQEKVIPQEASAGQITETRRAFYAGAQAMMTIFRVVGTDRISEDEGEQILVDADQELRRFAEQVQEGKA